MAKYKIYVNGKQSQNNANQQLIQQMAQSAANQTTSQTPQPDLRETVTELIKTQLNNPVEVPHFTTIQDILDANKGDKLGVFADYLNTPQFERTIGNFLPQYGYDPKSGRVRNVYEEDARRKQMEMQLEQKRVIDELDKQDELARNIYNAFNQRDIAEENNKRMRELQEQELDFRRQEAALDRGLKREQMAQQERLTRIIHGGGGSPTGGAAGVNDLKMTAAERKSYTEGKTTLANIEAGLNALEQNPKAYSFAKGILPADITNRLDPEGVATRTQIDNITAVYRKWLTGAQMSDKERKAYERFLPAPTDNYSIVKAKLNGMKGAIQRSNDAILSNYGVSDSDIKGTQKKDSLGLGI